MRRCENEVFRVQNVTKRMTGFGQNTLAVVEILLEKRNQVGIILENVSGNGSRATQLADSFTECRGQHTETGPRVK